MTKTHSAGQRLPWTTPTLKRIVAGAAEAANDTAKNNDGGGAGNNKS